jgi:branched-chain amino acid transport system substrate-binding protein
MVVAACGGGSEPIVIGLAGPLSQDRGLSMRRAAELAVREINERGGVRGRQIALRMLDDSANNDLAVRVARQLADDPTVVAVIGHLTSGQTLAAAPVYNGAERPVVQISPSASSPEVTRAGPYTFRVCPSDDSHGRQLAQWARQRLNARRAGIIYLNSDYGRGIRAQFATEFRKRGAVIVSEDPYLYDPTPFPPYVTRLRRQGVDLVMIAGERPGAIQILEEMRRQGWRVPVIGGDALTGIQESPLAEGVRYSSPYLSDLPNERNRAFVAAYEAAYNGTRPDHRGAGAYDIIYLLARTISETGTSRRAIRDYLAEVGKSTPAFEGVTGTIAFNDDGDVPEKPVVVGEVRGGRVIVAESQGP